MIDPATPNRPPTAYFTVVPSPLGELRLVGDGTHLTGLQIAPFEADSWGVSPDARRDGGPFTEAIAQLERYFAGELSAFSLRLAPRGTPFQRRVWEALLEIEYGRTTTYGRLAARLGHPMASRAVGLANGRNPIAIVIPCHRVVGSGGALTGYAAGVERKRWLLALESGHVSPLGGFPLGGFDLVSPKDGGGPEGAPRPAPPTAR